MQCSAKSEMLLQGNGVARGCLRFTRERRAVRPRRRSRVDARYHSSVTAYARKKDNNIHPDIRRVFGSDVDRRGGGFAKCSKSFTIALAGCAVYGMLDGLSSNVSSGHNTKMYTAALGPSYMLYAIRMPHTYRYNPKSAGCCGRVTVISLVFDSRRVNFFWR